jgi:hypothetical protein
MTFFVRAIAHRPPPLRRRPLIGAAVAALAAAALVLLCAAGALGGAFLQEQLPLKPLAATPVELVQGGTRNISVYSRQALTVCLRWRL